MMVKLFCWTMLKELKSLKKDLRYLHPLKIMLVIKGLCSSWKNSSEKDEEKEVGIQRKRTLFHGTASCCFAGYN